MPPKLLPLTNEKIGSVAKVTWRKEKNNDQHELWFAELQLIDFVTNTVIAQQKFKGGYVEQRENVREELIGKKSANNKIIHFFSKLPSKP